MSQIECRIGCTHVESIPCSKIAAWKALEKAAQITVKLYNAECNSLRILDLEKALEAVKHVY